MLVALCQSKMELVTNIDNFHSPVIEGTLVILVEGIEGVNRNVEEVKTFDVVGIVDCRDEVVVME